MINTMNWPKIKKTMKLKGFKLVSDQSDDKQFKGLFVKDAKVAAITKTKRGKIINVSWLDWTKLEPNDILLNETYYLEENKCIHPPVKVELESKV